MRVSLVAVLAFLAACAPQNPAVTRRQLDAIDAMEMEGIITQEQAMAFRQLVGTAAEGFDWGDLLGTLGTAGSVIALSLLKRRGPPKPMSREEIEALRQQIHAPPKS